MSAMSCSRKPTSQTIFIQPPSVEVLHQRLVGRGTDAPDVIATRIAKAEQELTYAAQFDRVVVNDVLQEAQREVLELVSRFIGR